MSRSHKDKDHKDHDLAQDARFDGPVYPRDLGFRSGRGWDDHESHQLAHTDAWPTSVDVNGVPGKATTTYKHCDHDGVKPILTVQRDHGPIVTFGGATGSTIALDAASLVLDLASVISDKAHGFIRKSSPPEWQALNTLCKSPARIVRFDWPDGRAPHAPLKFWQSAVKLIFHALPKGGHVIATCIGGHGRTGTCLAAFDVATSAHAATTVIDYIRETHCVQAIESTEQERYITSLVAQRDRDKVR